MLAMTYGGKMHQCQLCLSIATDGKTLIEGDTIALCGECSHTDERGTTFTHEGVYVVATNPRWGKGENGKQYLWPLNVRRR